MFPLPSVNIGARYAQRVLLSPIPSLSSQTTTPFFFSSSPDESRVVSFSHPKRRHFSVSIQTRKRKEKLNLFKDHSLNDLTHSILKNIDSNLSQTADPTSSSFPFSPLPSSSSFSSTPQVVALPVNSEDVNVLGEPHEFFQELCDGITRAKKRIVLASLYLGRGPDATHLIDLIDEALEKNPDLQVYFLMDYLRGTRSGHPKHWAGAKKRRFIKLRSHLSLKSGYIKYPMSSVSQILPLLTAHPNNTTAAFYHTPDLSGVMEAVIPHPVNESAGVQHMKAYVFDDDVVMSGANLEDNYFTDRLDRYVHFRNNPQIADYFDGLVRSVGKVSYELKLDGRLVFPTTKEQELGKEEEKGEGEEGVKKGEVSCHGHSGFRDWAKEVINDYNRSFCSSLVSSSTCKKTDTLALISLQMAPFNLRSDEHLLSSLLSSLLTPSFKTFLTSPYFNLTPSVQSLLLSPPHPPHNTTILVASPPANGFYFGKGLLPYIPQAYTHLLSSFLSLVKREGGGNKILMEEWMREGWTYHGKGAWWFRKKGGREGEREGEGEWEKGPFITNVGSSNYGMRSTNRDIEAQITLITEAEGLKGKLEEEVKGLRRDAKELGEDCFGRKEYEVAGWVRWISGAIKGFL